MTEQLGKIEKPEAEQYKGKRKLYLVSLLFSGESSPPEYLEKFDRYWDQVSQQLSNLESSINNIKRIYHEAVSFGGDEGLKILEKLNPSSYQIIKQKCESGAVLEAVEDKELAAESMDWERFLLMGFMSQKVANKVSEYYLDAYKKRYEYIGETINETLQNDETGLLVIREGHSVQFPQDIEVFMVAPPVLDEIHRWQRERIIADEKEEKENERD
jgi:hypothetical protein